MSTSADEVERVEHPREVLERGALVVDGEDAQAVVGHAARTPARNFGTVIVTAVPRPGPLAGAARTRRRSVASQAPVDVLQPDPATRRAVSSAGSAARALAVHPGAVVDHAQLDVGAEVAPDDLHRAAAGARLDAVADRVLDQRLQRERRDDRRRTSGATSTRT